MDTQFDLDVPLKDQGKAGWKLWKRRSGRKNKFYNDNIVVPGKGSDEDIQRKLGYCSWNGEPNMQVGESVVIKATEVD